MALARVILQAKYNWEFNIHHYDQMLDYKVGQFLPKVAQK